MTIRKTIFDSHNERELFVAINSYWSQRGLVLYPSLPFASIFDISRLELSQEERNFLLKTSLDYTLCTKAGEPLVSVEFDGICHGFSRDGRYVALRPVPHNDRKRHWKLDLKVRLATKTGYPLIVVSYHEKNRISRDTHLTIVDGILGQILAHRHFMARVSERLAEEEETLSQLNEAQAQDYIQDLALTLEVESDLEWNPLAIASAEAEMRLHGAGIASGWTLTFLDPPCATS